MKPKLRFFNTQSGASKAIITLISRVGVALVGIVFVPVYIRLIGAESYGLVAFYATLSGSLTILDLGLSIAISRKLAIKQVDGSEPQESKDLFFSIEVIYWGIALLSGVVIILFAGPIATHWVKSEGLSIPVIEKTIMLMGVTFAFQWPMSMYNGALIGLNKQITNAIMAVILSVVKAAGVIIVLKYVSATVESYFIWQAGVTLLFVLVLRQLTRHALPKTNHSMHFSVKELKAIWRFSAGVTGISLVTFFLSQIDKIVVSKMVLLEFVGYYTLAFTLSSLLTQIISPLQPVVFPKFSALAAKGDQEGLMKLYHKSCRWVSIIVLPIGIGMIFFAKEILLIWTHNPVLAEHTAPVMRIFAAGTICNSLMWMPYFFLLAKGITRFTFYQNLIAAVILVPLLFWWTHEYGILGASFVWLAVNAGYILISIPLLHSLYIKGELKKWYLEDFIIICLFALAVVSGIKISSIYLFDANLTLIDFFGVAAMGTVIYGLVIKEIRQPVFQFLRKRNIFIGKGGQKT